MPERDFPGLLLLLILMAALVTMTLLWHRQLRTRNATSVDLAWTLLIGGSGAAVCATGDGALLPRLLGLLAAVVWSGRLALHLWRDRILTHREEDGRYRALRDRLGPRAGGGFLLVYLLQAALAVVFAAPFVAMAADPEPGWTAARLAGSALLLLGIAGEAAADRQLAAHRKDPANRGRTCRQGMWRLSRHPNYFCEWLSWCGIGLLGAAAPHGWLAWQAPLVMFVLVRFVSGVPFAELQSLKSRGEDYRRYQLTTNAFFPWPRRSTAADPRS